MSNMISAGSDRPFFSPNTNTNTFLVIIIPMAWLTVTNDSQLQSPTLA